MDRYTISFSIILFAVLQAVSGTFESVKKPVLLSHRGTRSLNPENTLLSFNTALYYGGDVLETDVRLSYDGELIIFHDAELDRTTNGHGLLRTKLTKEILKLDAGYWYNTNNEFDHSKVDESKLSFPWRGRNVHPITLRTFLKTYWGEDGSNPNEVSVNIELKDNDTKSAKKLMEVIESFMPIERAAKYVNVVSLHCKPINEIRRLSNCVLPTSSCSGEASRFFLETRIATLTHPFIPKQLTRWVFSTFFSKKSVCSYHNLQLPVTIHEGLRMAETDIIDRAHELGKEIYFWVINHPDAIKEIVDLGADGVITDRTDLAAPLFNKKPKEFYKESPVEHYINTELDLNELHEVEGIWNYLFNHLQIIVLLIAFLPILALIILIAALYQVYAKLTEQSKTKKNQ